MNNKELEAKVDAAQDQIKKIIEDNNLIGFFALGTHVPLHIPDQENQVAMAHAVSVCINADNSGFETDHVTSLEKLSYTLQLMTLQHRVVFEKIDHLHEIYQYEFSRTTEKTNKDSKLSGEN